MDEEIVADKCFIPEDKDLTIQLLEYEIDRLRESLEKAKATLEDFAYCRISLDEEYFVRHAKETLDALEEK